mmetsp:Transcript_8746/g.26888  ORF Transcript_8746/g.26888 Transcript_8746/m.26888 type:complete len:124 (-) Transcript_8746:1249-1620(-)
MEIGDVCLWITFAPQSTGVPGYRAGCVKQSMSCVDVLLKLALVAFTMKSEDRSQMRSSFMQGKSWTDVANEHLIAAAQWALGKKLTPFPTAVDVCSIIRSSRISESHSTIGFARVICHASNGR